jgi:AhpD family alkylhydroperoxidase
MRLAPIEKPRNPLLRIGYWLSRRQLGKVPSVLEVFYARAPRLALLGRRVVRTLERDLSLEPELRHLMMAQASLLNGCGFCADLHRAQLVRERIGTAKFEALAEFRGSPAFSDRERAALAYAEQVTRTRDVSDATFQELGKHFSEREIVEVVWVTALGNYFNLIAVPLGLESDGLAELALASR